MNLEVKASLGDAAFPDAQKMLADKLALATAAAIGDIQRSLADVAGGSEVIASLTVNDSADGTSVGWDGDRAAAAADIDHGSADGSVPAQPFMDRALHAGVRAVTS